MEDGPDDLVRHGKISRGDERSQSRTAGTEYAHSCDNSRTSRPKSPPRVQVSATPSNIDAVEVSLRVGSLQAYFVIDDYRSKQWFHAVGGNWNLHEEPVARLLIHSPGQGMCFFDVGAHFGYYSVIASKIVRAQGTVYAFELDEFCVRANIRPDVVKVDVEGAN